MKILHTLLSKTFLFFYLLVLVLISSNCFAAGGFDFPAGAPDGDGYKNGSAVGGSDGWGYLEWNGSVYHPGEDWNRGWGETDFDDPLYSIGDGNVAEAKNYGGNWGKIILIKYRYGEDYIWAQYAHLNKINVSRGQIVKRGQLIGTIGNAGGKWASHLHFEIRERQISASYWPGGLGINQVEEKYNEPTAFINANRPSQGPEGQELAVEASGAGGAKLSWTKCEDEGFSRYELYRSSMAEGTLEEAKRAKVFSSDSADTLEYIDSGLYSGKPYYYRLLSHYTDGSIGYSEEVSITLKREFINITNDELSQDYPQMGGDKLVWQQNSWENSYFPRKDTIHYYDLNQAATGEIEIGSLLDKIEGPYFPDVASSWVCYAGKDGYYADLGIFCHNLATGLDIPINLDYQINNYPRVSESGYVVWQNVEDFKLYYTDLNGPPQIHEVEMSTRRQAGANLWGTVCAWLEIDPADWSTRRIRVKDLATGEIHISHFVGRSVSSVDIWGDYITWSEDGAIKLLNYKKGGTEITISSDGWFYPRIDSGRVVWQTNTSPSHLKVYDVASGETVELEMDLRWGARPVIYKNYIAFQAPTDPLSDSSTSMDIWLTWL